MTNETGRRVAKGAAHALRTATLRLALERSGGESDPTLTYGCVDWFRYDAPPQPQDADTPALSARARHDTERGGGSLRY